MKLMSAILLAVEYKTTVAQRELAVGLPGCYPIRQYAAHRELSLISNDAPTEVHHPAALGHDPTSLFGKCLDSLAACFVSHQSLQVLLGIAARQVEQTDAAQVGHILFGVEEGYVAQAVYRLLVKKRERLAVASNQSLSRCSHDTCSSICMISSSSSGSSEKSRPR